MVGGADPQFNGAFAKLRQFARKRPPTERCEMCSRELLAAHEHLVAPESHKILCACDACAILFDGRQDAKYKRVPRTVQLLDDFEMTDDQWDSLRIPIGIAFFLKSSPLDRVVALYPSPAGAVESQLPLDSWADIAQKNPVLERMDSDVVALLVQRASASGKANASAYYIVPIDECYKLVGLIRAHWRGLSGGTEAWREIGGFFSELRKKCPTQAEAAHA
jgi:hypothetical protein